MPNSPEWPPQPYPEGAARNSGQENRERGEVAPISEEFLEKFYTSTVFLAQLKEASKKVRQFGGREFGFGIWKRLSSEETLFTDIIGSAYEDAAAIQEAHDELESRLKQDGRDRDFIILGNLHFHSDMGRDPIIVPSGSDGDLGQSYFDRYRNQLKVGFDVPTIEMIATHLVSGELKLLAYQEPLFYKPMEQRAIKREIDETILSLIGSGETTQEDVINALQHYGYKLNVIRTSKGEFLQEELNK